MVLLGVLSIATALIFGAAPAVTALRVNLARSFKGDGPGPVSRSTPLRLRGSLVAAQIALAVVLLAGAGLLLTTFWRLSVRELNFSPEGVMTFEYRLPPGDYRFPYAPGLYVAALPFADIVTRNTGDMALLRIMAVAFDAVAAALLYFAVVRSWGDRLAAAITVALYHLAPLDFGIMRVGNLTNAFAQAVAVYSLVLIASPALRLERRAVVASLSALLAAAFLSHTSTFALLLPAGAFISLLFVWKGGPAMRSPAYAVALAAVAAALVAAAHSVHAAPRRAIGIG